jgi:hypothetical protein
MITFFELFPKWKELNINTNQREGPERGKQVYFEILKMPTVNIIKKGLFILDI